MNEKLIKKLIQEIGALRFEILHRDTIIVDLQEQIAQLQEAQETQA